MNNLLLELIRPSAGITLEDTVEKLTHKVDWLSFCSLTYRTGLAPLAHVRLRWYASFVPRDVMDWLRNQYYETAARNLLLLNTLRETTTGLSTAGIPVLALKGPVLAHFGLGLDVRCFYDLDLLVHREDFDAAAEILKMLGFVETGDPAHEFHRSYLRVKGGPRSVVELHFDLVDHTYSPVRPDIHGIWDRSAKVDAFGRCVYVPELCDHLLLLMIQILKHNWPPRLLADFAELCTRWGDSIDWEHLVTRGEIWGMKTLVRATLCVASSMLRIHLPRAVQNLIEAESYFRRVQWHVVQRVVAEQLDERPNRGILRMAPICALDRFDQMFRMSLRNVISVDGAHWTRHFSGIGRGLLSGASSLPSLLGILIRSAGRMNHDNAMTTTKEP